MDRRRKFRSSKLQAAPLVFASILGLGVGLVIGWLAKTSVKELSTSQKHLLNVSEQMARDGFRDDTGGLIRMILEAADPTNIEQHLKDIVSVPHWTGTKGDAHLVKSIFNSWKSYGVQRVEVVSYNVTVSNSDATRPNTVELVDKKTQEIYYRSTLPVLPIDVDWVGHSYPYPYYSYSTNGTVSGQPVFVNYGLESDYGKLVELGISVKNKIVIVKSGSEPCSKKILYAEKRGAIGLLMYPDPSNYAQEGTDAESVYPNTWWLPKNGIIGSSVLDTIGDPSTPNYPSLDGAYHFEQDRMRLPKILAQPINFQDAREILGRLGGPVAPMEWNGGMDIVYHIGPGFSTEFNSIQLKITSYNKLTYENVSNVIGTIIGDLEPDRYVLIGNHRDAWVGGAVDPGSGTAVIMEVARILGFLLSTGWRPRRTIKICSWGAEELGIIGSTEWVEENVLELQERAVSYINVDTCIIGDTFSPMMSPSLMDAVIEVAKLVPDPIEKGQRLYDTWLNVIRLKKKDEQKYHSQNTMLMEEQLEQDEKDILGIPMLGAYSDFAPFLYYAGIPVMDISWQRLNISGLSLYPVYHTSYESILYVKKFFDPGFVRHASCSQFSTLFVYLLTDSLIVPFNFTTMVKEVKSYWQFVKSFEGEDMTKNISTSNVERAIQMLDTAVATWEMFLKTADKQNPFVARAINDHQLLIHKAFINREAEPRLDSWFYRYGIERSIFSIVDQLEIGASLGYLTPVQEEIITRQLSDVLIMINQLIKLLVLTDVPGTVDA